MRAGTLFSGIDAPETAAPGIHWCWRAEIDAFANAVSEHRRPGMRNLGDVSQIEAAGVEPVDLLVFGSPCQSFSVAGKRLGLDDPRGNLALLALGLARQLRPDWLVFENVPGLLSSDDGRDFGAFLGLMGQCGYGWAYRVLDAQHFGVPQRRRRVFVVGHLGDWRRAAAVLFEPESLSGHPAPRREAGEGVARPIAAGSPSGSGYRNDADTAENLIAASSVSTKWRSSPDDASEDGTGRGTPLVPVAFSCKDHGADTGHLAPTLRAMQHDGSHANAGGQVAVAFNWQSGGDCRGLDLQPVTMALSREQTPATLGASAVRRLTPREAERLQGFPDDFTLVPYRNKPAADGPRYRALGNSMAVPCIGWILGRVQQAAA